MKKILLSILWLLCFNILPAQNKWEQPVIVRKCSQIEFTENASAQLGNGFVDVWTDFRNDVKWVYAQYTDFNGEKLWGEDGIAVGPAFCAQYHPLIYQSEDNHVIIIWKNVPTVNHDLPYYGYKAQKLNIYGERLWGNNGLDLNGDIQYLKSDHQGGFYYFFYNRLDQSWFCHVSGSGQISRTPFNHPNFNENLHFLQVYMLSDKRLIIKAYNYSLSTFILCADSTGNESWKTTLDNIYNKFSFHERDNQTFSLISDLDFSSTIRIITMGVNGSRVNDYLLSAPGMNCRYVSCVDNDKGESYVAGTYHSGLTQVWKLNNFGEVIWSRDVFSFPDNTEPIDYNYFLKINDIALMNNDNVVIAGYRKDINSKTLKIVMQLLNSDGDYVWEDNGRVLAVSQYRAVDLCLKVSHNNIHLFWYDHNQSQLSYCNFSEPDTQPALTASHLTVGFYGDVSLFEKLYCNGNETLVLWRDARTGINCFYYQVVDKQGTPLVSTNYQNLGFLDDNTELKDVKNDQAGNFILLMKRENLLYVQKIDRHGCKVFAENGFKVFLPMDTNDFTYQNLLGINGTDIFVFWVKISNFTDRLIMGQKISNGERQWTNTGKVIVPISENQIGSFVLEKYIDEENLLIWSFSQEAITRSKWTRITNDGIIENGLEIDGNEFYTCQGFIKRVFFYSPDGGGINYVLSINNPNQFTLSAYNCRLDSLWTQSLFAPEMDLDNLQYIRNIVMNEDKICVIFQKFGQYNEPIQIQGTLLGYHASGLDMIVPIKNIIVSNYDYIYDCYFLNENKLFAVTSMGRKVRLQIFDHELNLLQEPVSLYKSVYTFCFNVIGTKADDHSLVLCWTDVYEDQSDEMDYYRIPLQLKMQKVSLNSFLDNQDSQLPSFNTISLINYPNPFNPNTTIAFNLIEKGETELSIYNIKGQKVKTLHKGMLNKGEHKLIWNGKNEQGFSVATGVYYYKLKADKAEIINKMLLIK